MEHEEPLAGGNVSAVVRIGDRVQRQINSWSSAVHQLLEYLESQGFTGAPRFLGIDPQGREMLTFIEGEVGNDPLKPYMWSDEALIEMARLLRRYHDLTVDFIHKKPLGNWQLIYGDKARHEVICHNDAAPYNTVFVNEKPVALIDFDVAGPGPRIWDIAYTLYTYVPLSRFAPENSGERVAYDASKHAEARRKRIDLFCDAYGFEARNALAQTVEERLSALCTLIVEKADEGDTAFQKMIEEGHVEHYRAEISFHRKHFHEYFGQSNK